MNLLLIIVGCVISCSSIIANDYLKITIVLVCICVGLFGILKSFSRPDDESEHK
jgi:predicted membrane channel-forming protein YqfA (hemolysin III family)